MKIPKYIDEALKKRAKAANEFVKYDIIVSEWCVKHNVQSEDINGAVDSVVNADDSAKQVRIDILNT